SGYALRLHQGQAQLNAYKVPPSPASLDGLPNSPSSHSATHHGSRIMRQGPLGRLLCQINRAGWEKLAEAVDYRLRPLAALCGVPLWLLERLFKQRFRKAPVAWMRRLKCRRAAALLRAGQYLKEAAGPSAF